MTDNAKFEQFGLHTFYQAIPTLDNAADWFKWNEKVTEFLQISPVAEDGQVPPIEDDEASQWTHRQKFYSRMITAKMTRGAAQRIEATNIHDVQALLAAVKKAFKPEGSATYAHLQRQYMSLTRENCGSVQNLGAQIRRIHTEKLLLDPLCITSEIERTFFFMHALGPEYENFRDHIFRTMCLVNETDEAGRITTPAPSFDFIENKAIEEEHRKSQLAKSPVEAEILPALASVRQSGSREITPAPDGKTCDVLVRNAPYCSFCRTAYHVESGCFKKNPELKHPRKDRTTGQHARDRRPTKRRADPDDEDDDAGGAKNPNKPTFMATNISGGDINSAFRRNVECKLAMFDHSLAMMATRTLPIREAWIVDTGCAQHICNNRSKFVTMGDYFGPPLKSVDGSTAPSGVGTVNILCKVQGRRKWLVLDNVLFVPTAHANLLSVLQLIKCGAKVEFTKRSASIRNRLTGGSLYTASEYHGVYALNLWTNLSFPAYHCSPQMTLWHHRLAHLSDANLRRLKKQANGIRDTVPSEPCNPCLQGRMVERPHTRPFRRGQYPMEFLHVDAAGPFDEGLDGSRYWLTIVDDATGWIEITPIPQRKEFVIESLKFFIDHNERPERKCRRIRLDRIPEQVGEEMKFMLYSRAIQAEISGVDQHQQNGVAERAHRIIYDRVGPTLAHAKLPAKFWPEIARTAAFLSNRSPSSRLEMTPYQAWYGEKPDLSRLRVIGSRGEYMIPPKQRKKLTEPRTRPCILLGYEGNVNYRILLTDGRIIGTPNAEFHEILSSDSLQSVEDMVAQSTMNPEPTTPAVGEIQAILHPEQTPLMVRQASVPASGRLIPMAPSDQRQSYADNNVPQAPSLASDDDLPMLPSESNNESREQSLASDYTSQMRPYAKINVPQAQSFASDDDLPMLPSERNDTSREQSISNNHDSPVQFESSDDQVQLQGAQNRSKAPSIVSSDGTVQNDIYDNVKSHDMAQQEQERPSKYADLRVDRSVHAVQQDSLERHPELRIREEYGTARNSIDHSDDQLALLNVRDLSILPALLTLAAKETEPFEPKTISQAKRDASWHEWEAAMTEEVDSLYQNKTWELVDPPANRRILSGKWVFKLKRGPNGEVIRHKCRWVVRGFTQEEGVDYDETFASVVKPMSYKALLAIAAALGLEIEQMDVKTAFLYGMIDHEIYVEQPHGMTDGTSKVCKLRKAIYGLKQAPRIWYQTITNFLRGLGFEPINADLGVFVRSNMYIAVYVDDLLIIGPSIAEIKKIKRSLRNRFLMTDLGPCSYYLGMSVERDRQNRILRLSQEAYIEKVIRQFGMEDCKTISTPMETSPMPENDADYVCPTEQRIEYQRMIGSLMYIMLGTRADIAYPVSVASRYLANPGSQHMKLARRIIRYLKGTKGLSLTFKGHLQMLKGYTDADWAGCHDSRRSTAGYLFNIGSGAISWQSKRQSVVALSTCEAEFMGQTQATKEAIWLRRLLDELNIDQGKTATIIWGDNQGAIALAANPQYHSRTKHMAIQRKWQGEVQDAGQVALKYIATTEQIADGLTKALPRERLGWFRTMLGIE